MSSTAGSFSVFRLLATATLLWVYCAVLASEAQSPILASSNASTYDERVDLLEKTSYRGISPRISISSNGEFVVAFENRPSWLIPLRMRPAQIEPQLLRGNWVILWVAVWSPTDVASISEAVAAVSHSAKVNLGVRPFVRLEEIQAIHPDVRATGRTPIWLVIVNGHIVKVEYGVLSREQIEKLAPVVAAGK